MAPATAANDWHDRWGDAVIIIINDTNPDGTSIRWVANPEAWPYKAQTPDAYDDEKTRWITSRIGPSWSPDRDGGWYSVVVWNGNDTVLEFWFRDVDVFTEFSLRWC
jgi:hypothetical protein